MSAAAVDPDLVAFFAALDKQCPKLAPKHSVRLEVYFRNAQQLLLQVDCYARTARAAVCSRCVPRSRCPAFPRVETTCVWGSMSMRAYCGCADACSLRLLTSSVALCAAAMCT